MDATITVEELMGLSLTQQEAKQLNNKINSLLSGYNSPELVWQALTKDVLTSRYPFNVHLQIFKRLFPHWHTDPESAPAWLPSLNINESNIVKFMTALNISSVKALHEWSVQHYSDFWQRVIDKLPIVFQKKPDALCDLSHGIESPNWLTGAKMNIADSCFTTQDNSPAIIFTDVANHIHTYTYSELHQLSNRVANSLIKIGIKAGDTVAIAMPMTVNAIAIYLGIIKMGAVVVSIADSFSSQEMSVRLKISKAKAIFTQDVIRWADKKLPLYNKINIIETTWTTEFTAIVLPCEKIISIPLRATDHHWDEFLDINTEFSSVACDPMMPCNILFSSGTTSEPKAIVWNHTTPIKAASDAYFHQNIQPGDVLAWPTNLGWMMGPWLVFAALINHATIAVYPDSPRDHHFGQYVQNAKVTMLGVVPTLVSTWRHSKCMEGLDWSAIKVFSSTGECSNPEDMLYLMSLAGYKPVIEYCGGTEIGGAYISSTVIEKNYPALFNTAAMGMKIIIIDENGHTADIGEVAIIPPSIGLSTELLNADHHKVYYANMPAIKSELCLRRHGDQIKQFPEHHFSIIGRVDDSMNLGGIKISAVEIERAVIGVPTIIEVAAIAISPPGNGPSQLVIFATKNGDLDKTSIMNTMQKKINTQLNPLFKIHDVIFLSELPKTASNKILRRVLRQNYLENKMMD